MRVRLYGSCEGVEDSLSTDCSVDHKHFVTKAGNGASQRAEVERRTAVQSREFGHGVELDMSTITNLRGAAQCGPGQVFQQISLGRGSSLDSSPLHHLYFK
jgi:hypothetical protein